MYSSDPIRPDPPKTETCRVRSGSDRLIATPTYPICPKYFSLSAPFKKLQAKMMIMVSIFQKCGLYPTDLKSSHTCSMGLKLPNGLRLSSGYDFGKRIKVRVLRYPDRARSIDKHIVVILNTYEC